MFIAHRGKVSSSSKENTIEAFMDAINDKKYQGFELDIRESLDKKIVVVHDMFIGTNLISKTNYNDLKKYAIPLLSDVLKLDTKKKILIEIKDFNLDLDNLVSILNKYKDKNIYVMSFNNKIINDLIKKNINIKCGILHYIFNRELSYNEYDFICILNDFLTDNIVDYFERRNIEVFSYGIRNNYIKPRDNVYYIIDNKS